MLYDIWTVFWRDWIVLKRRLAKFILSRMVAPLLYLVAFGWGLGRSISVSSGTYLDFLVPGILALNSMNISFNSVIPVHAERIYHKSLEEYLVAPIRPAAFVIGWMMLMLPHARTAGRLAANAFIASMAGGLVFLHLTGIIGLTIFADMAFDKAFLADLAFVPGDTIKALLCALIVHTVARALPDWPFPGSESRATRR